MKRIGVMTSGGDSPGMNAAIRAVVRTAAHLNVETIGIRRGYSGLIAGDLQPLGPRDMSGVIQRGGTMLLSARCKEFYEKEGRARAAETCRSNGIEGLIVIGGDGTYHGAQALHAEHGIPCIGLPGTIDNDIGGTDFTIGYDTALNTAVEAIDRIRDTAESHERLFYVEVMGRDSGYIAMMSGIAGGAEQILVPETPTDINDLIENLRLWHAKGKNSCIVVVSEGDDAGKGIDVAKAVASKSEFTEYRLAVIGHLQRGGRPTAFDRILASRLGVRATEALIGGETGKMAGLCGNKVELRPLSDAWEHRTKFDAGFLEVTEILRT